MKEQGKGDYLLLHRKMLKWEWYDDTNTKVLFLHCLLKANWKAGSWHGIEYEVGQFITSLQTLAVETHLTIKQVRVALNHLKATNEVADQRQGNYRIITVNNWCAYQLSGKPNGKLGADQGQTKGRPRATDKEYKDIKESKELNNKKDIYGEYQHVKLTDSERDKLFNEFGEAETLEAIKYLDESIEMKGYKYKSHYLALRKWVFDAVKKKNNTSNGQTGRGQTQSLYDKWMNA